MGTGLPGLPMQQPHSGATQGPILVTNLWMSWGEHKGGNLPIACCSQHLSPVPAPSPQAPQLRSRLWHCPALSTWGHSGTEGTVLMVTAGTPQCSFKRVVNVPQQHSHHSPPSFCTPLVQSFPLLLRSDLQYPQFTCTTARFPWASADSFHGFGYVFI